MSDDQELWAIELIKQLKARYFNALDAKDWEAFGAVFTEDAQMDATAPPLAVTGVAPPSGGDASVLVGRAEIVRMVAAAVGDSATSHQGHMPVIELTGPETATGLWQGEDVIDAGPFTRYARGHYHEQYRIERGSWRIAQLELRYLRHEWSRR